MGVQHAVFPPFKLLTNDFSLSHKIPTTFPIRKIPIANIASYCCEYYKTFSMLLYLLHSNDSLL